MSGGVPRITINPLASTPSLGNRQVAGVSLDALKRLSQKRTTTRFANKPLQAIDAEVDRKRGVVRFREPVGHLVAANLKAKAQGTLKVPPRVRITFAYEDSADAREALKAHGGVGGNGSLPEPTRGAGEVQYHYSYLAALGQGGRVEHLNPLLVDPSIVVSLFPCVIEDDSFRMFVTKDGRTNKPALDARAAEIARQALLGPEDVAGEEGTAFGFFPIDPSSVISRVRWEAGPGVTKTEWSVQNVAASKARLAGKVGFTEVVTRRKG